MKKLVCLLWLLSCVPAVANVPHHRLIVWPFVFTYVEPMPWGNANQAAGLPRNESTDSSWSTCDQVVSSFISIKEAAVTAIGPRPKLQHRIQNATTLKEIVTILRRHKQFEQAKGLIKWGREVEPLFSEECRF